ncbi:MAG: hypothetical protein ACKPKO_10065, partial [Candidatus Fonsibacter sp.]
YNCVYKFVYKGVYKTLYDMVYWCTSCPTHLVWLYGLAAGGMHKHNAQTRTELSPRSLFQKNCGETAMLIIMGRKTTYF